jgi:hypothetical protein
MKQGIDVVRRRIAGAVAFTGLAGAAGLAKAAKALAPGTGMPSLGAADAWLNSTPLTPDALRGKVVLVQFWTYSCINWMRTLP